MTYLVQVQHSSDHKLDGRWFTLEGHGTFRAAVDALLWFQGWRRRHMQDGFYQSHMGYYGRPLRVVLS